MLYNIAVRTESSRFDNLKTGLCHTEESNRKMHFTMSDKVKHLDNSRLLILTRETR